MDNVLIKFSDTGLDEIAEKLLAIGQISKDEFDTFQKVNASFAQRQALTNQNTSSMQKLADAAANAEKNIVNGATNKAIQQTGQLLNQATTESKKYADSLQGLKQQYKDLVAQAISAGTVTPLGKDFLAEAAKVKQEIKDIGAATTELASHSKETQGLVEGVRAIGAGFEVAQGAQVLFGSGNKDLEKQLVKIQGTMALVNGLQELQNLLMGESVLKIGLQTAARTVSNAFEKIGITLKTTSNTVEGTGQVIKSRVIVVQAVENALTSESVIVRGAATAAQWLLNNAMLAFPLIAIIAGLAVVIGLFAGFGESIDKTAAAQIKLNEQELANIEILQKQDELINKLSAERTDAIQREIDLLKSQQGSADLIRIKEKQLQDERNRNAQFQDGIHSVEIDNLEQNRLAVIGLTASLAAYNKEKSDSGKDTYDKTIDALKGKLDIAQALVKEGEDAQKNAADQSLQSTIQRNQQEKDIAKEGLAYQKDIITSKLRFAQEGSEQQLALNLAAAKNERDTQLVNLKASNESRADIEAAYLQKERDLQIAYNNRQLQDKLALVDSGLVAVKKGTDAELDLKLKQLDLQHSIELNNIKLADSERLALTQKYLTNVNNMILDFAKKQREDSINTQILINDAKLAVLQKGDQDEYILKQKNIALNEQLELNAIDRNMQGTELGEAKKADIIAKYEKQSRDLQQYSISIILAAREGENTRLADLFQKRADIEANNVNTSLQRRQQLELEAFDNTITRLEKQKNIEAEKYLNGETTYQEYQNKLTQIADEQENARLEKTNAAQKQWKENLLTTVDLISQQAQNGLSALAAASQTTLAIAQDSYDRDIKANDAAYAAKAETQAQYEVRKKADDTKLAAAKKKAAQQDKDITLFQIAINTAQAAIKAVATAPNYLVGAVEAGLAIAFGAIQYAAAAAKPIPAFAKGTENAPEGWAWVGEKGPELVWMKAGSKVKTHEKSINMAKQNAAPTLRNSYFEHVDRAPIPSKQAQIAMGMFEKTGGNIDISLLSKMIGDQVGEQIGKLPFNHFTFDKNGFGAAMHEGNSVNTFLNNRYSSR